ncbi:MAG TPA: hypothetical protein VM686_24270, partial [Polyangiaceae bacterium]|nr:hypothetical protein [Polyangiaceae bacterium]
LELLVCHKDAAPPAAVAPPAETLLYVDADDCPSDWQRATEMEGRFLVGAPSGGLLGADFGGADLGSGEQRPHDHPISGSVSINPQAVAATTGGGTLVGASGFAQITGVAQFEEIAPLRLELRYCRKL